MSFCNISLYLNADKHNKPSLLIISCLQPNCKLMTKLFRRVRQKFLFERKKTKYFKYAIGEIVLVVIGILIALQINNWNENRINNKRLKSYLTEIVKDFKNDSTSIRNEINHAKKYSEARKTFLAIKDYNTLTIDSLEKSLETFYSKIPFSRSTFDKIESSGITNFGEYETLIEHFKTYYSIIIPDLKSFEGTHNRAVDTEDNYWRYQQNNYEFSYDGDLASHQNKEEAKKQLIQLLKAPTARNILKIDFRRNKNTIERLNRIEAIVIKLIETTETKLKD